MKKAGNSQRSLQEREVLTSKIISEYWNNFWNTNEIRAQDFFHQLHDDCEDIYLEKMEQIFDDAESHFEESDLQKIHCTAKDISLAQVRF